MQLQYTICSASAPNSGYIGDPGELVLHWTCKTSTRSFPNERGYVISQLRRHLIDNGLIEFNDSAVKVQPRKEGSFEMFDVYMLNDDDSTTPLFEVKASLTDLLIWKVD